MNFKEQLQDQLMFLKTSAAAYDNGHLKEAVRIAVCLRVMFHDTTDSTSLVTHLGLGNIPMLTTREIPSKASLCDLPLLLHHLDLTKVPCTCELKPRLEWGDNRKLIPFSTWWKEEKIVELDFARTAISRKRLVQMAANKDGGAHVAAKLDPLYIRTASAADKTIDFVYPDDTPTVKVSFQNLHYASLRQLAFEVLESPALMTAIV